MYTWGYKCWETVGIEVKCVLTSYNRHERAFSSSVVSKQDRKLAFVYVQGHLIQHVDVHGVPLSPIIYTIRWTSGLQVKCVLTSYDRHERAFSSSVVPEQDR